MSGVMAISGKSFAWWNGTGCLAAVEAIARRPEKEKARRGMPGAPNLFDFSDA